MKTFVYRNETRPLYIDIYYPEHAEGLLPGVVFFFGGGWRRGTRDAFRPFAEHLARRGMLAAVADYRIKNVDNTDPTACVMDGKSVMRYLRQHAHEIGLDPDRLAASGGSAGGHVAAATACVEKWDHPDDDLRISPKPNALALFVPVINNGPDQFGYKRVKDYYLDFSPAHRISEGWPPTTVMLGTADVGLPVAVMQDFAAKIREVGSRCDEHYFDDQPHGFFNYKDGNNPFYFETLNILDDFMVSIAYLAPTPA